MDALAIGNCHQLPPLLKNKVVENIKTDLITITIAIGFNCLDIITGTIAGYKAEGKFISSKMRDGLFKKMGFIICYILGISLKVANNYIDLGISANLIYGIVTLSIMTELVSIVENAHKLNNDLLPETLKKLIGVK